MTDENEREIAAKIFVSLLLIGLNCFIGYITYIHRPSVVKDSYTFLVTGVVEKEYQYISHRSSRGYYIEPHTEKHKIIQILNLDTKEQGYLISTDRKPIFLNYGDKYSLPNPNKNDFANFWFGFIVLFITIPIGIITIIRCWRDKW